ncbi:hypothetical protein MRQ86_14820 [Streptomyces sp. MMS21 TC-5]|uniref:helix-turn-helix domain-containing protein n=1 Tax=Streptomyces sp. MMS21 TC-5 TaxID=2925833 RepID=UPI001F618F6A|nr:helix-turn-helix transcriptional regulator [Streptomyces sp. MMS21 TC-5]MCI4081593.1 hypothetical protein [Streptomyces sp. MMS21 TC-5]
MTEMERRPGTSGEIEAGEVLEVAALGNVLLSLFNRLGISQAQYAIRIQMDKSSVSRYLGGKRLAPQDFIDRLIREVDQQCGTPLTQEAHAAIKAQYLSALQAVNPERFELESLREKLNRSQREVERTGREIAALHLLLEQKEQEVQEARKEVGELLRDWSVERNEFEEEGAFRSGEVRALLDEIERLREDLTEAERRFSEAESRSSSWQDKVFKLEAALAEREVSSTTGEVSIELLMQQLEEFASGGKFAEISRELAESTWGRTFDDVWQLYGWCVERLDSSMHMEFVRDIARFRSPVEVASFGVLMANSNSDIRGFVSALAPRLRPGEVVDICERWQNLEPVSGRGSMADYLLAAAVRSVPYGTDGLLRKIEGRVVLGSVRQTSEAILHLALEEDRNWISSLLMMVPPTWPELRVQVIGAAYAERVAFAQFIGPLDVSEHADFMSLVSKVTSRVVEYWVPTRPVTPVGSLVAQVLASEGAKGVLELGRLGRRIEKLGWLNTLKIEAGPYVESALREAGLD